MSKELLLKFKDYNSRNPEIYKAFESFALTATRFRKRFSAKTIIERIRWNSMISGDDGFKINNSYTAYYARLFHINNPKHYGFFEVRKIDV